MNYISDTSGDFLLAGKNKIPKIHVVSDEEGILRAAEDLRDDIEMVTKIKAQFTQHYEEADIVIQNEEDGRWECFTITLENQKLILSGSDKRGTIYSIYDLSQNIGVSPWYWWADVAPEQKQTLYVKLKQPYISKEPSVKYRGIFINDEACFDNWALNKKDYDLVETYQRVYELLLRLKANLLWPAMHPTSPHFHKNPENAKNADIYGIVIGTSHCEQMMRNNVREYLPFEQRWEQENPQKKLYKTVLGDAPMPCAYVYTDQDPQTGERVYNKELILDYWRESVARFGSYQNMYTMGMRGLHDSTWQPAGKLTLQEKARLLEEIICAQRSIFEDAAGKEVPQLFVPYKEILEIYNAGMQVPEDITLMWTNDNYGYIRQLPTSGERERSGGIGMYYHFSYYGHPKPYTWLCTTPFALIKEEMTKAYDHGVDRVWVANAGDIKPAEKQIEYFMELAYDISRVRELDLKEYLIQKAKRDFRLDQNAARKFAETELEAQRLAFARKPEFFESGLFQLKAFNDEGQLYLDQYNKAVQAAEELNEILEEELKPAYFELYLYSLRSCRNVALQYIMMDEQRQHLKDGYKNAAERYIYLSDQGLFDVMADTKAYGTMLGGKWDFIINKQMYHFVERNGNGGLLPCKKEWAANAGIGVAHEELFFSGDTKDRRFIDIFNHYSLYANWTASADQPWVILSKTTGIVLSDERIWITIDYSNAPKENTTASVVVTSDMGDHIVIPLTIHNQCRHLPPGTHVETNGYVSVSAKDFSGNTGEGWKLEKYLGRQGDSIKITNQVVLEYNIFFETTGSFEVDIYRIPTLDERGRVEFGIGLEEQINIVECTNSYLDYSDGTDAWGKSVLQNCEVVSSHITVTKQGVHKLKLCAAGSEVMIEKIVIWTKDKVMSYFGPPSSKAR